MLVSVIMPVYNTEEFLAENITSILDQDYQNIELILVDDGSTDLSTQIMADFAEQDKRVVNAYQKNSGAPTARNHGLSLAKGDYIYFVDSDDEMATQAISKMVAAAEETDADIIMGQFDIVDEQSRFLKDAIINLAPGTYRVEDSKKQLFSLPPMPGNKLIKASLLRTHQLKFEQSLRQAQDLNFYLKKLFHAEKVTVISDIVYHYRIRLGSISHTYSLKVLDTIKSLNDAEAYYAENGREEKVLFTNIKYAHFTTKFQKVPQMAKREDRKVALQAFKAGFDSLNRNYLYKENRGKKYAINQMKFLFGPLYISNIYTNYQNKKAIKNNPYEEGKA